MEIETVPVATEELIIGMYVTRLDRPWLETPFLFQGFYIRTREEIEQLRSYCRHVFVDVTRSNVTSRTTPKADAASRQFGRRFFRRLFRRGRRPVAPAVKREVYGNSVSLKEEIRTAVGAHDDASRVMGDVMQALRGGHGLDLRAVREAVSPMIDSVLRNEYALAWLTRLRNADSYAYRHSVATGVYSLVLGRHLGLAREDLDVLGTGGLLLDIGLTRVPVALLEKTEALTQEEIQQLREHVEIGVEILRSCEGLDARAVDMVRSHHERYNGTGYPRGLEGGAIPLFGRIGGIVDSYHAMTSPRPFANAMSPCEVLMHLNNLSGVEFQAELVEQFIQAVGVFPTGTLVELSSGEVGIVIAQNRVRRLRPKVMVVLGADKQRLEQFRTVDLRQETSDMHSPTSLWITRGLEPGAHGIDPSEFYL